MLTEPLIEPVNRMRARILCAVCKYAFCVCLCVCIDDTELHSSEQGGRFLEKASVETGYASFPHVSAAWEK